MRDPEKEYENAQDVQMEMKARDEDMAINALSAQPETHEERTETHSCDCISRQEAIDALEKVAELYPWRVPGDRDSYSSYNEAWQDALNRADSEIEALPPAQPERKKGTWTNGASCPFCGYQPWYERDIHTLSFCPSCGADLRGGK